MMDIHSSRVMLEGSPDAEVKRGFQNTKKA